MNAIKIDSKDNVAVLAFAVRAGESIRVSGETTLTAIEDISAGHKVALTPISPGKDVVKYGFPIGEATAAIKVGQWVHTHNLKTKLGEILDYSYNPLLSDSLQQEVVSRTFPAYRRKNGSVGIRNEIWIIPTVSCVNRSAEMIAHEARKRYGEVAGLEGIFEFKHPHGCSQIGEDHLITQKILADLIMHPNAGSVLVLGLGCENNHVEDLKKVIGTWDESRVKFLIAQEVEDEIESGLQLIEAMVENIRTDERVECSLSDLRVGLECGGSDAFSGITANPIVGTLSDLIVAGGGTTVLTEVPEMFGAETILMDRACDKAVFQKTVELINDYKSYFIRYDQPIYENPSYGNKEGGLTTLEEKSLGCIQKGGRAPVSGVLKYGETLSEKGLNLLSGPGNDIVSCTGLAAAGCQLVVFTTGRGTPLGTCVPTIKVATNSPLYDKKKKWFDFNGGRLLEGNSISGCAEELLDIVVAVCGGHRTRAEEMGCREIAILKDGVTC